MKALNGRVIVELEKRNEDEIQVAGKTMYLDNAFRGLWNAVQIATIVDTGGNEFIEVGDKAYVHHFVAEKEHQLPFSGGNYSWLEFGQIFCVVRDGLIFPLNNFIFVKPVLYGETDMDVSETGLALSTHSSKDEVERIGVVKEVCLNADRAGLDIGDKVLFGKSCEYSIEIEGVMFYRMELQDIICVLDSFKNIKVS